MNSAQIRHVDDCHRVISLEENALAHFEEELAFFKVKVEYLTNVISNASDRLISFKQSLELYIEEEG